MMTLLSLLFITGPFFPCSTALLTGGTKFFNAGIPLVGQKEVVPTFTVVGRTLDPNEMDTYPAATVLSRYRGASRYLHHATRSPESAKMEHNINHTQSQHHQEMVQQQQKQQQHMEKKRQYKYSNVGKRQTFKLEDEWPSYPNFSFTVESKCKEGTAARTGLLKTPHGDVQLCPQDGKNLIRVVSLADAHRARPGLKTPAFIFCATKAAMKGLSPDMMRKCGSQIILSNTYHLHVQPGEEAIQKMGGLQECTKWRGPMLTDSGGYQIFSMGHGSVADEIKGRRGTESGAQFDPTLVSIGEKGARFKSYFDCSFKSLTPEKSMQIQRQLGADLVIVLDECTPFHVEREYTEASMHRTHRWALRSLREFIDHDDGSQALYGIVQGGIFPDLRKEAVAFVNNHPFFGIAVGGSLGADKGTMHAVVKETMTSIRRDRPVHLLGIGGISDIFHGVRQGIDTFDCVQPTRLGRHGSALVKAKFWEEDKLEQDQAECTTGSIGKKRLPQRQKPREHVKITKGQYRSDNRPIDKDCGCPTCKDGYSRAYLQHLMKAGELLGGLLVSQHNVYFMNELMTAIRRAVREGTLDEEEKKWVAPGLRSWDFQTQEASARSTGGGRQGCWDARANVNGTGGAGGVTEKIKRASEGRAGVLRS